MLRDGGGNNDNDGHDQSKLVNCYYRSLRSYYVLAHAAEEHNKNHCSGRPTEVVVVVDIVVPPQSSTSGLSRHVVTAANNTAIAASFVVILRVVALKIAVVLSTAAATADDRFPLPVIPNIIVYTYIILVIINSSTYR